MAVLVNGIGYGPVQAPQDAMLIGGMVGQKNYILPYGNRMALSIVDANTVRAADGVLIVSEGKRLQNIVGSYDDFSIPAGSAGVTKYFIARMTWKSKPTLRSESDAPISARHKEDGL